MCENLHLIKILSFNGLAELNHYRSASFFSVNTTEQHTHTRKHVQTVM